MSDTPLRRPRKGEEFEVLLEELDARGGALGTYGPHKVRVSNAVPGMRVLARAGRKQRGATTALAFETLDSGPDFVPARCSHTASCGGCSFQELRYERQLAELGRILARTLFPLGVDVPLAPVLGCDEPFHYRNKMDFTFGNRRWIEIGEPEGAPRDFAVGLHVPGRYDKVLDVRGCAIAFAEADAILSTVRRLAREHGLSAWDVREHVGLLRNLVLRKGIATGEIMANLVTSEDAPELVVPLIVDVVAAHPEITTFVQNVNSGVAVIAVGEREIVHHGDGWIHEEVLGRRFRISANSFFQTNTRQAERLVEIVRDRLALEAGDVLFDLYCGGGLMTLGAGAAARETWGFELVPEAIADATRNAELNGAEGTRWVTGDMVNLLTPEGLLELGAPAPDRCVVDPPRAGMHTDVVEALARLAPRRVVYVSCNPASAARDVAPLLAPAGGYVLRAVDPVDLFPHTPHLECVLTLDRTPSASGA